MATTEQFSLRWNNFHSNLTLGFHELLQSAEMVDVTLAVEGHFLQAHKVVLSICSPYFKQMFKENPCKHPIVILNEVRHHNMKDILEFMYMGEVNVLRENLSTFLRTAELLQVKGLTGDDSSDTSSRKDDRMDNDEEPDMLQYSQLMDSDVELPHFHPLSQQRISTSNQSTTKRQKNSQNSTSKRSKSDNQTANQNSKSIKTEQDTENNSTNNSNNNKTNDGSEYLETSFQMDNNSKTGDGLLDETKDNIRQLLDNSTTDDNPTDPDMLLYAVEQKMYVFCPYCCKKFVNRYNLKVHIRDKHEDNPINLDCRICGKTMRNRSCLRVHMYHHRKQQ